MKENKKYYVVFDLETTGLDKTQDHIIQFAGIKVDKKTNEIVEEKNLYIQPSGNYTINIMAFQAHHIHPDFLKDKPYLSDVADEIETFLSDSDIITYNGNHFDISFLSEALAKVGKEINFLELNCYDVFLEEKRRNGLKLIDVYKRYNNGHSMDDDGLTAHDAFSDVKATYNVFKHQMDEKPYEPEKMVTDDNFLSYQMFNDMEMVCFTCGKYKGLPINYVITIDKGYLNWIVDKSFCSTHTKKFVKDFMDNFVEADKVSIEFS